MKLSNIFKGLCGVSFISITTKTTPVLTGGKKNEMQGLIVKRSVVNGYVFTNTNTNTYLNAVKKLVPDFVLSARRWGTRLENLPVVEHKDTEYLELIIQSVSKTEYFLNDEPIKKSDIIGLKVSKATNGVVIRDYKAASIESLRYNKQEFCDIS